MILSLILASPPKAIVERISQPIKIKPLPMTLGDLIRTDQCYRAITIQMVEFLTPTAQRRQFEQTILESMSQCFKAFDPVLKVHPCGSVAYGFGGTKTNYNILIDTRMYFAFLFDREQSNIFIDS